MQCDTFADIYLELLACSHGRQLLVMKMGQPSSHFKFFYVLVPSVLEYLKLLRVSCHHGMQCIMDKCM